MKRDEKKPWEIVYLWWQKHIEPRETIARARALSAELRRGKDVNSLCQPEVQTLIRDLGGPKAWPLDRLLALLSVLANVRAHTHESLATRLGGGETAALSPLRFERLMTAEGKEFGSLMRRAVLMAGPCCNVTVLARDMLIWNDAVRARWCFDYFGADAPRAEDTAP